MNKKPVVRYTSVSFQREGGVGGIAFVYPIDHPDTKLVSNTTIAITSRVVSYDEATEVFETLNTVYVPA